MDPELRYFIFVADSEEGMHERKLLNNLLRNYNPLERPVAVESEPLNVTFGLTLQQIIDVVSFEIITFIKYLVFKYDFF